MYPIYHALILLKINIIINNNLPRVVCTQNPIDSLHQSTTKHPVSYTPAKEQKKNVKNKHLNKKESLHIENINHKH